MQTQTISVEQLKSNIYKIITAIQKGRDYTLVYGSKPVARIEPLANGGRKYKNLLNPPKSLIFHSKTSAVELIRKERN